MHALINSFWSVCSGFGVPTLVCLFRVWCSNSGLSVQGLVFQLWSVCSGFGVPCMCWWTYSGLCVEDLVFQLWSVCSGFGVPCRCWWTLFCVFRIWCSMHVLMNLFCPVFRVWTRSGPAWRPWWRTTPSCPRCCPAHSGCPATTRTSPSERLRGKNPMRSPPIRDWPTSPPWQDSSSCDWPQRGEDSAWDVNSSWTGKDLAWGCSWFWLSEKLGWLTVWKVLCKVCELPSEVTCHHDMYVEWKSIHWWKGWGCGFTNSKTWDLSSLCHMYIYTYIIVQVRECCKGKTIGENRSVWFVLL